MPRSSMIRRYRGKIVEICIPGSAEGCVSDLLDQGVGFAAEDAMALLNRGPADGLRQMPLARARRAEEQRVFVLRDESRGGES